MSDDEDSVSFVRCSNTASWNKNRLDIVTVGFEVTADSFKSEGASVFVSVNGIVFIEESWRILHWSNLALLDHREDSTNVFSNDPIGLDLVNALKHVRPEIAVIVRASTLPGVGERLAGESAREDVDLASPFGEIGCCDVVITFCVWVPII